MNSLAEIPGVVRTSSIAAELPPPPSRGTYVAGLLAALGVHAAILFLVPQSPPELEQVEFLMDISEASIEVTLVAAPPAEEPAAVVEPPPEPVTPPPPEPIPEPAPVEPVAKAEMTLPEPKPVPTPPPVKREKPKIERKEAPKPKSAARPDQPVGDGSSAVPGSDATTAQAAAGGDNPTPSYLRNPQPKYPEEARRAKQEGPVTLRITYDASGALTNVRVVGSSGFPLLDERAQSTVIQSWRVKPMRTGGTITQTVRFRLPR